jgi:hypothetical protein
MRGFIFLFVVSIFMIGCSSGGTVIAPGNNVPSGNISSLPVGVISLDSSGNPVEGMGALGLFNVHVDPINLTADISSLRKSALTDVLEVVDITNFLQLAPCTDCLNLKSITLDSDGHPVLSIGIRHPFTAGDPLKPISGKNRADLHVFNVEGTLVSNTGENSFSGLGKSVSDLKLINADGYSEYLDSSLDEIYPTDASLHPYITHFDDYSSGNFSASNPMGFESVTTPPPTGNLVMAMGCDYDYKDYVLDISDPVDFIFAVGCTYAVSAASKIQRFTPEFRIPQHNKKAASEVAVQIVTNELAGGITSSSAELEIRVVDINHNVAIGTGLDQMFADSSVSQILIEIPQVTTSPVSVDVSSPASGTGHDPSDPLVYRTNVFNQAGADTGNYTGLVKVIDSYNPGQNTSPLLNGQDGIKRVDPVANPLTGLFAISEFATYQAFGIEVFTGNEAPVCDLQVSNNNVGQGAVITANPGTSHDPDGNIISYEYDDDYNGSSFTADVIQNSGDPDFGDPVSLNMPCNSTGGPITVTVAMRICDDGDPSRCTICTEDITVTQKLGAVGDVTVIAINRGESGADTELITSLDLDWEDNPCGVAEYAIERGDGYDGTGWSVCGTSSTSSFKFQPSGMDWDNDIRLRVIARAVVGGDPGSDSDPSEEVFCLFVSNGGYETPGNTWLRIAEDLTNSYYWHLTYWYGGGPNVDNWKGNNSSHIGIGPVCWYFNGPTYLWSIAIPQHPFPDLVGQKEAFCDGYYQLFQGWPAGMGLCFGTVSNGNPNTAQTELYDFNATNEIYGSGTPYTVPNIEGLNYEFGETNQGGYQYLAPAPLFWAHVGFYLNDLLDDDRDYPAIGLAIGSTPVQPDNCVVGWNDGFVYIVD